MWASFDEKIQGGKVCKNTFIWCLDLQKHNTYRREIWEMNLENKFAICFVIYFFGQGLKRRQERKDKTTQYFPYPENN